MIVGLRTLTVARRVFGGALWTAGVLSRFFQRPTTTVVYTNGIFQNYSHMAGCSERRRLGVTFAEQDDRSFEDTDC